MRRYLDEIVYPVANQLDISDLMEWLRPYLVMRLLAVYDLASLKPRDAGLSIGLLAEALAPTTTLPDFLALTHEPYLLLARIGDGTEEPGWQDVSGWYARNLRIFVNLTRIVSTPDDRVLLIFGQGHAPLLRHFVEASCDFTLAEPADYIRE